MPTTLTRPRRRVRHGQGDRETPHGLGFAGADRSSLVVAALALAQCLRAKGNYVVCAFIPFLLPVLWALTWPSYRERLRRALAASWSRFGIYAVGGNTPWRATLGIVVLPALLVSLSNDHAEVIGDTSPVIPTAISLIRSADTNLDEFCRDGFWGKTIQRTGHLPFFLRWGGGHVYSAYPSGMVPLALPVVGLSRLVGGNLADPLVHHRLEKLTAAAVAALALGVFFLLALHLVRPAPALATTAILGLSSGMLTTVSQNLWQHDGIVLGSLVVLLLEFRGRGRPGTVVQGLVCAMMLACRLTAVAFLVPFGAWVLLRSPRRAVLLAGVAAVAFLPWAAYYAMTHGNPLGPSTGQLAGSLWTADVSTSLAGLLISPGRGLLTYQPWVVLAPLAFLPTIRRGDGQVPAGWDSVCASSSVFLVGIVSAWWCWWGGWCWGSRLVIEAVPLLALLSARPIAGLVASRRGRFLVATLAMMGVLMQVPAVYLGAFRWNADHAKTIEADVWSWWRAPFLEPLTLP
jgi:hypothetical protein